MQKYYLYFSTYWSYILSYRTSWLLWRFRQFLLSFMALSLWSVIYSGTSSAFGYDRSEIFSYIFYTTLLQNIILSTSLNNLGNLIYSGDLSNILVKPVSTLGYLVSRDAADKLFNTFSTLAEMILLFFIFKPTLIVPSLSALPLLAITFICGLIVSFSIQVLFGSIGFWSPDTWGPRFLFYILIDLTSGKLFPLDVLPEIIKTVLLFTPFPYLTYMQVQLSLGRTPELTSMQMLISTFTWAVIILCIAIFVWKKGMKQYQAAGQ